MKITEINKQQESTEESLFIRKILDDSLDKCDKQRP